MATKQVLFKDLGKRLNDLVTKDFPSERQENKIEYSGTTANRVTFETNFVSKKDGSVVGTFTPKYRFLLNGLQTQVLAELNTRREFKGEVTFEEAFVRGLKTVLTGQTRDDEVFATLAVEYKHETASVNASVDYGRQKGSNVKGGVVVGNRGFSLGASADYFLSNGDDSTLREFTTTLAYSTLEFDATAFGRMLGLGDDDKNEFGATYYHKLNLDTAVGTEVLFDTLNSEVKPKLVFGAQHRLQEDTTLKAKFDTNGKLGFSFQQRLNKNARLTLASTVDTNNLAGKGASTFGFTLSLND